MKVSYRGHEIDVTRDRALGGWICLYYSIFRESDGYECTSGFYDGSETVREFIRVMKERVDNELREDDPWMEKEEEGKLDALGVEDDD